MIILSSFFVFFGLTWLFCVNKVFPKNKTITLLTAIPFYISFIAPALVVFATFSTVCINLKHQGIAYFSPQEKFNTGEIIHPIPDSYSYYQNFLEQFLDAYRLNKDNDSYLFRNRYDFRYDFSYALQSFLSQWHLDYFHPMDLRQVGYKENFLIKINKKGVYEFRIFFEEKNDWSKEKKDEFKRLLQEKIESNDLFKFKLKITELSSVTSIRKVDVLIDRYPNYFDCFSYYLEPGVYRVETENLKPLSKEIECRTFLQIYMYKKHNFRRFFSIAK